eukprot:scaffold4013_cov39-Attheya_sp.AAC.1
MPPPLPQGTPLHIYSRCTIQKIRKNPNKGSWSARVMITPTTDSAETLQGGYTVAMQGLAIMIRAIPHWIRGACHLKE